MKTIQDLCKAHRRTHYYEDGEGLIGVYNHRGAVLWYRWTAGGYSVVGETATPQGAIRNELSKLKSI